MTSKCWRNVGELQHRHSELENVRKAHNPLTRYFFFYHDSAYKAKRPPMLEFSNILQHSNKSGATNAP